MAGDINSFKEYKCLLGAVTSSFDQNQIKAMFNQGKECKSVSRFRDKLLCCATLPSAGSE